MKRTRSDSAAGAVKAAAAAVADVEAPAHVQLREGDRPFWLAIVRARAADTWTAVDLAHAANLARCQADIERLSGELIAEGDVVTNARGTPVVNPKHTLLETLSRRAVALSRMLHVHAEATVGKSEDASPALKAEKKARAAVEALDDDDLIPRGPRLVA